MKQIDIVFRMNLNVLFIADISDVFK